MEKWTRTTITMRPSMMAELKRVCEMRGFTQSEAIAQAMADWFGGSATLGIATYCPECQAELTVDTRGHVLMSRKGGTPADGPTLSQDAIRFARLWDEARVKHGPDWTRACETVMLR